MINLDDINGCRYFLKDDYFWSDNFKKGRGFKKFFDNFCRRVFELNLNSARVSHSLGWAPIFPIGFKESNSYASFGAVLYEFMPCVWSEYPMPNDEKNRRLDFICFDENLSVTIEVKRIGYRVGSNLTSNDHKTIDGGLKQIYDIQRHKDAKKDFDFKILLLNTPIYFGKNDEITKNGAKNALNSFFEELGVYCDGRRNMGLLAGVLDMTKYLDEEALQPYCDGKLAYMMLCAVVLGNFKY